jgi:hypothetical protein
MISSSPIMIISFSWSPMFRAKASQPPSSW